MTRNAVESGKDFQKYQRRLPHWRGFQAIYFVTWSLGVDQYPLLPDERMIVARSIEYFNKTRYDILAYIVMDDHVHVLVKPKDGTPLQNIVQTWKSYTSHQIRQTFRRRSPIWRHEYYDHIVRERRELENTVRYIYENAPRRWQGVKDYEWCKVFDVDR